MTVAISDLNIAHGNVTGSSAEKLSANCSALPFSPVSGRVIVSGVCAQAVTTRSGVVYNLIFNVIGAANQTSGLSFTNPANNTGTFQFNNGTPTVATANGQFTVLAPTQCERQRMSVNRFGQRH